MAIFVSIICDDAMIRKRLWAGLAALCISVASWGQAVDSCYYSDGRAMVPVEEGVEAQGFFAEHAPDGLLREECDKVYEPNSPCNKDMGDHHFKGFLELYNLVPVKRTSYLFSNYSGADDEGSMERRFRMTIPYFQKNHIVPLEPREETVVKGVKNYATFFAVGKNRVGYKTVVSFDDRYMIAILGFVRFDGLWFLTESHVGFLDYPK